MTVHRRRDQLKRLGTRLLGREQRGAFVASAISVTLAAFSTLVAPRIALTFTLAALVLVGIDLRRRIRSKQARDRLEHAIGGTIEAIIWEEIPGTEGAMRVMTSAERFMGYTVAQWREPYFWQSIVHADDVDRVAREVDESSLHEVSYEVSFRAFAADGTMRWLENRVSSVRGSDDTHLMYAGVMLDRTLQIEAVREADVLRQVVEESPLPYLILSRSSDDGFDVASMNMASAHLFGVGRKEMIGKDLSDLIARRSGMDGLVPAVSFCEGDRVNRAEVRLPGLGAARNRALSAGEIHSGPHRVRPSEVDAATVDDLVLEVVAQSVGDQLVSVGFVDITERVLSNERLSHLALHDTLTQLPNRRLLAERLTSELERAQATGIPTALVVLDLNEFKEVNDALGHEIGDQLLRAIGDRLSTAAPENATVARLGGDEFAVLLPATTLEEGTAVAYMLAEAARGQIQIDDLHLSIRASMGVVAAPEHGYVAADLMRFADVAMYISKRTGDDVTCYEAEADPFSKRRIRLLGELEAALENGQFEVYYQPIVDLETDRTVATEGLSRWRHPELGIVGPGEFIELAEVTGTIGRLTRFVIERVLEDAKVMERAGFAVQLSCNLSARNLFEADLVESVGALIDTHGLPVGGLRLEITEGDVMEDVLKAQQVMRSLTALGPTLAIDDFGTGHSSLERLRDLPVSCVKIDQGFVRSMMDGPRSHTLLRDIITMLENLGFTTVAEGVEDHHSREQLAEFGCTFGQGYLWARPLPLPEFLGLMAGEADRLAPASQPIRSQTRPTSRR